MKQEHLSEEMIRQLAAENDPPVGEAALHLKSCADCREQVEMYRLIQTELDLLPMPSFSETARQSVLQTIKIKQEQIAAPSPGIFMYLLGSLLLTGLLGLIYKQKLEKLMAAFQPYALGLVLVAAILLLAGLLVEQYREYKRKIKLIQSAS